MSKCVCLAALSCPKILLFFFSLVMVWLMKLTEKTKYIQGSGLKRPKSDVSICRSWFNSMSRVLKWLE